MGLRGFVALAPADNSSYDWAMPKTIKPEENQVITMPESVDGFTIIGDPGCDGMGATPMSRFAKALSAAEGEFVLLVGDIVPTGERILYQNMAEFIETVSPLPVYALPGNHDTRYYGEYFGGGNYAVVAPNLMLIILDDADRTFSESSIEFLSTVLSGHTDQHIILSFHIPPPNPVSGNSIKDAEWNKISTIIEPYRRHVRYILCGHVHSFFDTTTDGIPLLVTGGGGARIEFVSESVDPAKAAHHIITVSLADDVTVEQRLLSNFSIPIRDEKTRDALGRSFQEEAIAHVRYRFFAEEAEDQGFPGLAALFRAASDAEYYHARNHFYVNDGIEPLAEMVEGSIGRESHEVEHMYREYLDYSEKNNQGLARYTFFDALAAERVHRELFRKAHPAVEKGEDIPVETYYTCTSCGYTFAGDEHPSRCPICGAPRDKIRTVE